MAERQDGFRKYRNDLLKVFIPNSRDYQHVPDCFGTQPQGGQSAWAKGCTECSYSSSCRRATIVCDEILDGKKYECVIIESTCEWCEGAGILNVISGATRQCHICKGKGKLVKYEMKEITKG